MSDIAFRINESDYDKIFGSLLREHKVKMPEPGIGTTVSFMQIPGGMKVGTTISLSSNWVYTDIFLAEWLDVILHYGNVVVIRNCIGDSYPYTVVCEAEQSSVLLKAVCSWVE